jgi:hypothetical protein
MKTCSSDTCEFDELSKPRRDFEEIWRPRRDFEELWRPRRDFEELWTHNRVIIVGSEFLVATLRNHEDLVVALRKYFTKKLFEVKMYMLLCYLCYLCMFSHVLHGYVCPLVLGLEKNIKSIIEVHFIRCICIYASDFK